MKNSIKNLANRFGFDIVRQEENSEFPPDISDDEKEIYNAVKPFTMTSVERVLSLIQATRYVLENNIPGDFVECGVWRGGSMMVVANVLKKAGVTSRKLYLYDTFEGMTAPTEFDRQFDGKSASEFVNECEKWCYADLRDVSENLFSTGYPKENIIFVKGKVEETIPQTLPENICLLRLDTDWYESTKHELAHLYPKLVKNGVLIIDDYGHWQGAKQATDEYFENFPVKPFLQRVDYTGRITIKND